MSKKKIEVTEIEQEVTGLLVDGLVNEKFINVVKEKWKNSRVVGIIFDWVNDATVAIFHESRRDLKKEVAKIRSDNPEILPEFMDLIKKLLEAE